MTIYIDSDYKCHTATADGLTAIDTDYFDGKCQDYTEGYRFVPSGQTWTRPDGVVFRGEMVSPPGSHGGSWMPPREPMSRSSWIA